MTTQEHLPPGHIRLDITSETLGEPPGWEPRLDDPTPVWWIPHPPSAAEEFSNTMRGALDLWAGHCAVLIKWNMDTERGINFGGEAIIGFKTDPHNELQNMVDMMKAYIIVLNQKCEVFGLEFDAVEAYEADPSKEYSKELRYNHDWARLWNLYCQFVREDSQKEPPARHWLPLRVCVKHPGKEPRFEDRSRLFCQDPRADTSAWNCPSLGTSNVPSLEPSAANSPARSA